MVRRCRYHRQLVGKYRRSRLASGGCACAAVIFQEPAVVPGGYLSEPPLKHLYGEPLPEGAHLGSFLDGYCWGSDRHCHRDELSTCRSRLQLATLSLEGPWTPHFNVPVSTTTSDMKKLASTSIRV